VRSPQCPHRARNCGQYTQGDGWVQRRDRRTSCRVPSAATTAATAASTGSVVCHRPPSGRRLSDSAVADHRSCEGCPLCIVQGRTTPRADQPGRCVVLAVRSRVQQEAQRDAIPSGSADRGCPPPSPRPNPSLDDDLPPPPPQVGGRGRKCPPRIKKSEVQQALGIGSSWMSDAHRAMTLRWKFGEGGTSPRQDVIRVCTSTAEDDRMGARALLGYLAEQEH
jgi:hypothetical protein